MEKFYLICPFVRIYLKISREEGLEKESFQVELIPIEILK